MNRHSVENVGFKSHSVFKKVKYNYKYIYSVYKKIFLTFHTKKKGETNPPSLIEVT
jgi:hypothetical protein